MTQATLTNNPGQYIGERFRAVVNETLPRYIPADPMSLLPYTLHAGQVRAWESQARFVAVIAGTQSGKTSFGPSWLYREIQQHGVGDYLAVTATYDLFKLKLLPELTKFLAKIGGWSYQATDRVFSHNNGSRIILRSADASGGLESATARAAWLDECGQDRFGIDSWEAVQRRLSLSQGRVLMTTTPYNLGWLKQQVYDRAVGGNPEYEVVSFRSVDNPAFPVDEFERARATLPDWKFRMFYCGEFSHPAGMIYGDYIDSYRELGGHMMRPFPIPETWQRTVGIDFGAVNTALVWIAEDPISRDMYCYRETQGGGYTGPEHARRALEYKEPVRLWVGGSKSEQQQRDDWSTVEHEGKHMGVAEPWISDVEAGIDRVIGLFKQRRLYVFETLHELRSDLGTYSREVDDAGEPLQRIKDKEQFHLADALRYGCSTFELLRPELGRLSDEKPASPRSLRAIREFAGDGAERETEEYR
jgi:hypothetical protein